MFISAAMALAAFNIAPLKGGVGVDNAMHEQLTGTIRQALLPAAMLPLKLIP